ncbi:hypothetical protein ACFSVK_02580 [Azorhizophilus paspali]|uniref:hypothetical protein n=1 Tax=Azorhizophilus paspali TaxID=69963 RepID=UPI00362863CD
MIDWGKVQTAEAKAAAAAVQARGAWKAQRASSVAQITVTTAAGNSFDGDEISQGRMARAIIGLQAAGDGATLRWVLADNSVIQATAAELTEALTLAGRAQAELWVEEGPDSPQRSCLAKANKVVAAKVVRPVLGRIAIS